MNYAFDEIESEAFERLKRARRAHDAANKAARRAEREERQAIAEFNDRVLGRISESLTDIYGGLGAGEALRSLRRLIGDRAPLRRHGCLG